MSHSITDIRFEGYYISEDDNEIEHKHTKFTEDLYELGNTFFNDSKHDVYDGIVYKNGIAYAEFCSLSGDTDYIKI